MRRSVWEDALGLSALEPMLRRVPVIASAVGGIPDVVLNGERGLLVLCEYEEALDVTMRRLLEVPEERQRFGQAGRQRVATAFDRKYQVDELAGILGASFGWFPDER